MPKTKETAVGVIKSSVRIADAAEAIFNNSNDLNALNIAIKALSNATKTAVATVRYKEATGTPDKMDFFE